MTESDKNILNEDRFNYSIAFMKAFFSFCVICCHFYFPTENLEFYPKVVIGRMQSIAVPIFVTITFYFTGKALAVGSIDWIKKRMIRLLLPFWGWGILYFFGFRVIDFIVRMLGFEQGIIPDYTIKDLFWQLTLGSDRYLCPPLWYQFDLIVLMIVLWAVGRFCSKCFGGVIVVLGVLAIGAQYFGLNYLMFGGLDYEVRYSTGRILEILPMACIGIIMGCNCFLEKIKSHRVQTMIVCLLGLFITAYGGAFTTPAGGFGYGGTLVISYAVLVFAFFYVIPFEKMPQAVKKTLKFLSKYCLGIYCLHFGVGYCWNNILGCGFGLQVNNFVECICLYIICIFLSWLISLIPVKYVKLLVE